MSDDPSIDKKLTIFRISPHLAGVPQTWEQRADRQFSGRLAPGLLGTTVRELVPLQIQLFEEKKCQFLTRHMLQMYQFFLRCGTASPEMAH